MEIKEENLALIDILKKKLINLDLNFKYIIILINYNNIEFIIYIYIIFFH